MSISADHVTIEVEDKETGLKIRRDLPLEYFENDNGIRLRGESLEGKPVEIVFVSQQGIDRITDLTGRGAQEPRCDNHG